MNTTVYKKLSLFLTLLTLVVWAQPALATGLRISDVRFEPARLSPGASPSVEFTVGWQNAWRNAKNHDAAWIFIKVQVRGSARWRHALLSPSPGIERISGSDGSAGPDFVVPEGRVGFFAQPGGEYRGDLEWRLRVALDPRVLERIRPGAELEAAVFGLEMVYIPSGPFYLGDPDPESLEYAAFFRSKTKGEPDGPFPVSSEEPIQVGPQAGRLYYQSHFNPQYEGDRAGPIPQAFPKGYRAFYIMKYEITQGQYAAFLNNLPDDATYFRAGFAGRYYYDLRGSIQMQKGRYLAVHPARPHNFVSWDDGCAFTDWAGLRPMTELEFTKAARGPGLPRFHEFPWGTSSKENLKRIVALNDDLVRDGPAKESRLREESRDVLGASYYWVLDLAGSLWERVVTAGHPVGRAYRGTHGDGRLTGYGFATNQDWPRGDDNPGGYGYRGGGYYQHGRPEGVFNPHSPIAYRRFGAWGGGPRYLAYGFRCVRTAP